MMTLELMEQKNSSFDDTEDLVYMSLNKLVNTFSMTC